MNLKTALITVTAASIIFISAGLTVAQEQPQVQPAPVSAEPEMQWVWGEVVNLDPQNKMVLVKYLDYETDQEKEMTISVDEKTTYENIKSIEELKQNDAVSVDYIVAADGKNLARNISLEKPEPEELTPIPEETEGTPAE
jgi:hypothetical protein